MPGLLITEIQIPKMNGIERFETINRDYSPALIKLIFIMTSRTDADIRTSVEPQQHIKLMEKPLSIRCLPVCLNKLFPAKTGY